MTLHDVIPTLLIDQQETLLAMTLEKKSYEALQSYLPLNSIDDKQCTLRNTQRLARTIVFFPLLIGILLTFHYCIVDFIEQKKIGEANLLKWVELVRKKYGDEFYLRSDLPQHMEDARLVGNDEVIPFWKLQAPIFIDRKRQLFFSWYKGKVYAARYSQVGVSNQTDPMKIVHLMGLAMYTLDDNNALTRRAFQMCLSYGSLWGLNTKLRQDEAHAFIVKYLLQGKEAVATTDYKRFPALFLFLFKDKKPADFDQQLERILAELDRRDGEKINKTDEPEESK
ncbi:hypothetical protein [Xenorhabdus griffiniae]|uniref:Uncharacterized protein n=1 Tax=Xenorhabdus griffiniae TaxID=351672 RepID=A0ABY9XH29_9GAMM|nr:hypothetical protein [Xenorhabdus griffiniae]MBD1228680.1 hypothetical protein [Xenorhabdus griffiniae]MBE8588229.1 hypothetical protein [Xenorhabdus griffiniae]WMV72153.1 hypothetical protein QL128_18965 [Xenorhabdus griffiniae]WNH01831.1 hypothetical protein QL112_018975 [Xenorhabdus griffiniae]